jgi:hypothetical protein
VPTVTSKELTPNKQWESASATDNTLVFTVDPTAPPKLGQTYVFKLEVFDDSGNKSQPVQAQVTIVDTQAPTAVVNPPIQRVNFNTGFTLSGAGSTDTGGGRIAKFVWTLVQ